MIRHLPLVAAVGVVAWAIADRLGWLEPVLGPSLRGTAWLLPWLALLVVLALDLDAWRRLRRLVPVEALKTSRSVLLRAAVLGSAVLTLAAAWLQPRLDESTGWSVLSGSLGSGFFAAEVFVLVLGATAISGEASAGTLKMMLPHAYRRSDWVLGKAAVLLGVALVLGTVVTTTGAVHAAATEGLGDVMRVEEADPLFPDDPVEPERFADASTMRGYATARVLTGLGALAATGMLGLLLSVVFQNVVASLCGAFLLFAGLKFADVLFRLPEEIGTSLYGWYPDRIGALLDKLGRALSEGWDDALLTTGLSLSLMWGALFLLLAVLAFRRSDVHV